MISLTKILNFNSSIITGSASGVFIGSSVKGRVVVREDSDQITALIQVEGGFRTEVKKTIDDAEIGEESGSFMKNLTVFRIQKL